jgi:transcriptional regulator GlxA family with amidase domain
MGVGGVLVACGRIRASYQNVEGIFDFLHEPVVADLREDHRLRHSVESLIDELAAPQPGSRLVARALMQQCLVLLLRRQGPHQSGDVQWLAAARDERLWSAVSSMLEDPAAAHTLERLAETARMSRSTFAEHFSSVFGRGPIDVLKEMRMRQAARLLLTTDGSVKRIAAQIGYASRSYFTRAFTEAFGVSPARYRASFRDDGASRDRLP